MRRCLMQEQADPEREGGRVPNASETIKAYSLSVIAMQGATRLGLPAKKFFIRDLQQAIPSTNTTSIANLQVWDASALGLYAQFSIVWVQGRISSIALAGTEGEDFQLEDSTAEVRIKKPITVTSGCTALTQGRYVMVVGELQSSGAKPVIKALKIQDVSDDTTAPGMWELEVKDMYRYCT